MGLGEMFSKVFKKSDEGKQEETPRETHAEGAEEAKRKPEERARKGQKSEASPSEVSAAEGVEPPGADEPPQRAVAEESPGAETPPITKELVLERLSEIYDPEIPIDIVNLGLIYEVEINGPKVHVQMTMTSPGCPTSAQIAQECQFVVEEISGVEEAWVEIVWDPPWDPSKMSPEARESLGI